MKRKSPKRSSGQVLLTSSDLRRLEAKINADIKARDAANGRLAENRKLLEAANLFASLAKRTRKTTTKVQSAKSSALAIQKHAPEARPLEEPATPAKRPRGGGSYTIVMNVLRAHPEGLVAPEVKRMAAQHPEAPVSIREHGQYIYSVLDTLKLRGEVTRASDGRWKATTPQTATAR